MAAFCLRSSFAFCFNDTASSEIYTLSLHDALPISKPGGQPALWVRNLQESSAHPVVGGFLEVSDRKSTRLNSSHANISYAVFCLKKKKKKKIMKYQDNF